MAMSDTLYPSFDKNGKYLYFTASTDTALSTAGLDMSSDAHPISRSAYVAVLSKDEKSPLAPESDEEKPKDEKKADQDKSKDKAGDKDKSKTEKSAAGKKDDKQDDKDTDKDSKELRKRIADELLRCAHAGRITLIELQQAGMNILQETGRPTKSRWFGWWKAK